MTLFHAGEQHNTFRAVIHFTRHKKNHTRTQWKRTIMHTEVLLCRQITAVLQVKIVVPIRGGPHQEAVPGCAGRKSHIHTVTLPALGQTERAAGGNTKPKNPLGYKLHWTKQTANVHKHHLTLFFFHLLLKYAFKLPLPPTPPHSPQLYIYPFIRNNLNVEKGRTWLTTVL